MLRKFKDGWLKCKKCGGKTLLSLQDIQEYEQVCCFECGIPLLQKEPGSRDMFNVINEAEMIQEEENNDASKG